MKKVLYFMAGLLFAVSLCAQAPNLCPSKAFFQTFGTDSTLEVGITLCPSADSNLYASGVQGNRTLLMKLGPTGNVIWSRAFTLASQKPCLINEMIVDSEGMLVAAGLETDTDLQQLNPSSLVFRYDPTADSILWIKRFSGDSIPTNGIIEKRAGGNFVFYQNSLSAASFVARAELLELDRRTGNIVPGVAQRFSINNVTEVTRIISHKGSLYGIGTAQLLPYAVLRLRTVLMRLDTTTGQFIWSKFSSVSGFSATNTIGLDILVDNDTLVSLSTAANLVNGTQLGPGQIYLQKNTLNGNLVWIKKYDFPTFAGEIGVEVVKIGNNYAIYGIGTTNGRSAQLLLLVDHNGNVMKVKQVTDINQSTVLPLSKGEAVVLDKYLVFAGTIGEITNTDWSILKTDSILSLKGDCSHLQTRDSVAALSVTSPLNYNATVRSFPSTTTAVSVALPFIESAILENHLLCSGCPSGNPGLDGESVEERGQPWDAPSLRLYPNPTTGRLLFDLTAWKEQVVQVQVLNARGQLVQTMTTTAAAGLQSIQLGTQLPNGLYQLVIRPNQGVPVSRPFVLER